MFVVFLYITCFILLAALYVGEQYRERIVVLPWQSFQYLWHCRQAVRTSTIKGKVFLRVPDNNINANAQQSYVILLCLICYCLPFLILNFVNKSSEIPVNTLAAWWMFFIKAFFNLPHFLDYRVYQRYGRKYLKTWMPVVEECGMFQVT